MKFFNNRLFEFSYIINSILLKLVSIAKYNRIMQPDEISITYNTHRADREVIIETVDAKTAMLIAIGDFQHNGWIVDTDYENYKQLKG